VRIAKGGTSWRCRSRKRVIVPKTFRNGFLGETEFPERAKLNNHINDCMHFCISAPQHWGFKAPFQILICSATDPQRQPSLQCNLTEGDMFIANVLGLLRSWRRYNTSLRELNQLGDRELQDIGISRSDIPRIAWENAQR
jgi:uncharacterized protein YjiS (DUF1127 family)